MSMLTAVRRAEDSGGQQGTPDCYQCAVVVVDDDVVVCVCVGDTGKSTTQPHSSKADFGGWVTL